MQIIQANLMDLKIDPANVRQTDRAPDEGMLASIREKGVIVPLTVRKNGKEGYFVTDGGKRLAALHILARDGEYDKAKPVPCVLRDLATDADAADISLTTNFIREDMHSVDVYEAFALLKEQGGKSAEDIAKEYGLPVPDVRGYLALGLLSPKVRQAWKEGLLGDQDYDDDGPQAIAQLFTLAGGHKEQDAAFDKLKKQGKLRHHWQVKDAIVGNNNDAARHVAFVGVDAYKQAGGVLVEDLFGSNHRVEDAALAKKLVADKLKGECERLVGLGWSWAEPHADLPKGCEHSWNRDYCSAEQFPKTKRKDWGLALYVNRDGKLDEYVLQKPEQRKAAEKAAKTKEAKKQQASGAEAPKKEFVMSAALAGRLSEQMTKAAAAVLETDVHLALASMAAAMTCYDGPVCIDRKGAWKEDAHDNEFAEQLALFRKKSPAELAKLLAALAASALDMGGHIQHALPLAEDRDEDRALLEALDPKKLNRSLRDNFDAADYFGGVTRDLCTEAIQLCDPKYPFTGKEKKADLAKLAAELVTKSNAGGKAGYLPPEMRTKHYDGPKPSTAKAKAKAVGDAKAREKAAKKKAA